MQISHLHIQLAISFPLASSPWPQPKDYWSCLLQVQKRSVWVKEQQWRLSSSECKLTTSVYRYFDQYMYCRFMAFSTSIEQRITCLIFVTYSWRCFFFSNNMGMQSPLPLRSRKCGTKSKTIDIFMESLYHMSSLLVIADNFECFL